MANKSLQPLVVSLDSEVGREVIGGKAVSLGAMIRAGLPVPGGFCATTDAYRLHLSALEVDGADSSARRNALLESSYAPEFQRAFEEFWHRLGWDRNETVVAVRSSASAEDLHSASFAGQYESYLPIRGLNAAMQKVRHCWASGWSPHAKSYEGRKSGAELQMGVVVQALAPTEAAGVIFTAEPVFGNAEIMYMEAVSGFGEGLVGGTQDPLLKAWVGHSGQLVRADVLSDGPAVVPLNTLSTLASIVSRIERLFGLPQDVEWTWASESGFSIVQSRPMTVLPEPTEDNAPRPWHLPGRPEGGWTDSQRFVFGSWDEYNARAILPLDWDLYDAAAWEANIRMFDNSGDLPHVEEVAVALDGVVIGIDPAGRQGGRQAEELTRVDMKEVEDWPHTLLSWRHEVDALTAQAAQLSEISSQSLLDLTEKTAGAFRRSFCQRMASMAQWINPENGNDPVASCEEKVRLGLQSLIPDTEVDDVIADLSAGIEHETARMNSSLWELKRAVAEKPSELSDPLFEDKVRCFIQNYGHFEIDNVSIAANPGFLWSQLKVVAEDCAAGSNPDLEGRERFKSRMAALRPVLDCETWSQLQQNVMDLRYWISVREDSKSMQNLALPLLERLTAEIAFRLLSAGAIIESKQLKFLRWSEARNSLLTKERDANLIQALEHRRVLIKWKEDKSWLPSGFLGREVTSEDNVFNGEGGSPGTVQGPARLVTGANDFSIVRPDEIVVAYSTNPVWTQIFGRIAGIVVERGGRTSHAAVVAREYGIPAVLGVPGLTSAVQNGEILRVDGSSGEVRRVISKDP